MKNAINGYVMDHCRHSHLPIHPFNFQVKYVQTECSANSHKLKTNERCILKSALTRVGAITNHHIVLIIMRNCTHVTSYIV